MDSIAHLCVLNSSFPLYFQTAFELARSASLLAAYSDAGLHVSVLV